MANETKQSSYEKKHGLVPRSELREIFLKQTDALDDQEFHEIYSLVWKLGAGKLLYKLAKESEEELKNENAELKAKLAALKQEGASPSSKPEAV